MMAENQHLSTAEPLPELSGRKLVSLQSLTRSTYRSLPGSPTNERAIVSLRHICGALHSLALLVEDLNASSLLLIPGRNQLDHLAAILYELNHGPEREQVPASTMYHLERILGQLRLAVASRQRAQLLLLLSTSGFPRPPTHHRDLADEYAAIGKDNISLEDAKDRLSDLLDYRFDHKLGETLEFQNHAAERDALHPSYGVNALWLPHIARRYSRALREDLGRLFAPRKTHNFKQWLVEYVRKRWPDQFGSPDRRVFDLLELVSNSSLETIHVAAALGLTDLCRYLVETDAGVIHKQGPIGTPFHCALVGPEVFLQQTDRPLNHATNTTFHYRDTLQYIIDASTLSANLTIATPFPDPSRSVATVAFFVCNALVAPGIFVQILRPGLVLDNQFLQLFHGVNSIASWPRHTPPPSMDFLEIALAAVLDFAVVRYDYENMKLLADGVRRIIDHYHLAPKIDQTLSPNGLNVTENGFSDMVRRAVNDCEVTVLHRLILDHRWCPNLPISPSDLHEAENQERLLHAAVEFNHLMVVKIILESSEAVDIHARNEHMQTPVMLCESPEMFRLLRIHDARTTDRDDCGRNIWHYAAANSDINLIDALNEDDSDRHLNLRGRMTNGQTPIAHAIIYPLLRMKADGDQTTKPPEGALHMLKICKKDQTYLASPTPLLCLAARWGSEPLVTSLIAFGADASVLDSSGQSALHYLNVSATKSLVEVLIRAGCVPAMSQTPKQITPAESIFSTFGRSGWYPRESRPLDEAVFMALLTPEVLASRDIYNVGLWERFIKTAICEQSMTWSADSKPVACQSAVTAVKCLIQAGALNRFEKEEKGPDLSGMIQLVKGCRTAVQPGRTNGSEESAVWLDRILELVSEASNLG